MISRSRSTACASLLALLLAASFPAIAGAAIFGKKKVEQDTMPGRKLTPAQSPYTEITTFALTSVSKPSITPSARHPYRSRRRLFLRGTVRPSQGPLQLLKALAESATSTSGSSGQSPGRRRYVLCLWSQGGLDYRVTQHIVARADFEYQHWAYQTDLTLAASP